MAASRERAVKTAAKVEEPKNEVQSAVTTGTTTVNTESAKATEKPVEAAKNETVKEPVKQETVKKNRVKKETVNKKPAKKETVKKEAVPKATSSKKAELENELHIQFGGKSYSQEELVKIAKDVWEYDLNNKPEDLKSVELYVKPEESMVYYVMNKDIAGSFYI